MGTPKRLSMAKYCQFREFWPLFCWEAWINFSHVVQVGPPQHMDYPLQRLFFFMLFRSLTLNPPPPPPQDDLVSCGPITHLVIRKR